MARLRVETQPWKTSRGPTFDRIVIFIPISAFRIPPPILLSARILLPPAPGKIIMYDSRAIDCTQVRHIFQFLCIEPLVRFIFEISNQKT